MKTLKVWLQWPTFEKTWGNSIYSSSLWVCMLVWRFAGLRRFGLPDTLLPNRNILFLSFMSRNITSRRDPITSSRKILLQYSTSFQLSFYMFSGVTSFKLNQVNPGNSVVTRMLHVSEMRTSLCYSRRGHSSGIEHNLCRQKVPGSITDITR